MEKQLSVWLDEGFRPERMSKRGCYSGISVGTAV